MQNNTLLVAYLVITIFISGVIINTILVTAKSLSFGKDYLKQSSEKKEEKNKN